MALQIRIDTVDVSRLANAFTAAGEKAPVAIARALNHTGAKARTAMIKSLTAQTGLKRKTIVKALKVRKAAQRGDLSYTIWSRGGDISLKYFSPKEVRKGVSAKPFGRRTYTPMAFLKGGRKPNRVTLNMGGHVYRRTSAARTPIEMVDSGVIIPQEMVSGATEAAFYEVAQRDLADRLGHEIYHLLHGK
jgi:hypothetical protein